METKTPKHIEDICKDISIISEHNKGNQSANIRRKLKRQMKRYKATSEQQEEIIACQEDLKQHLQAKTQKLNDTPRELTNTGRTRPSKKMLRSSIGNEENRTAKTEKPPDPQETKWF